jgi:hypothetical protein
MEVMSTHTATHFFRLSSIPLFLCFVLMHAEGQSSTPAAAPAPTTTVDGENPIAAAARDTKARKSARAKKVITDEDMEAIAGPLPHLRMEGPENGDEVVAAIAVYKANHTPEQTEQAVRLWYDRYDELLAGAIQEDQDMRTLRDANYSNGYDLCQESQDYQKCQSRQMAEMRAARNYQRQAITNNQLEARIQHAFSRVRMGLMQHGLNYKWFKIRTTNGIDTF